MIATRCDAIFAARPDVLNHNVETVPRLQRAVRPSAGYARSLGLARAGEGCGPRDQVGAHRRHGRDRRRGRRHPRRPPRGRRRHRDDRPVLAADELITFPSPGGCRPTSFDRFRREGEASGSRTSRPRRSPAPATTPGRRDGAEPLRGSRVVPCRHDRTDFRVRRPVGESARGDGHPGRRRAAALGRRRPAVAHRLRGDAARAAHDARRPSRWRSDARRAAARGAAGRRATGMCSRSGRGPRPTIPSRSLPSLAGAARHRGDRRHDVGALPPRPAEGHALDGVHPRRRRSPARSARGRTPPRSRPCDGPAAAADRVATALQARRHRPRRSHRGPGVRRDRGSLAGRGPSPGELRDRRRR